MRAFGRGWRHGCGHNGRDEIKVDAPTVAPATDCLLPLTCVRAGEPVRLIAVQAGKSLNRRLSDMGLPVGAVVEVVPTAAAGPMLVEHGGTRIALGRGLASKLMVQPAETAAAP